MDSALTVLAENWPFGALLLGIVALLRKGLIEMMLAPRNDRAAETLLSSMNEHLVTNLKLFVETNTKLGETNAKLEAVRAVLVEILAANRDIHTELVRRK